MHSSSIFLAGLLLVSSAAATPAELQNRAACQGDNLNRCFSASSALASEYCSKSLTWSAAATTTLSMTPTITSTSVVTITGIPPASNARKVKKRAAASKLLCTTYEAARLVSACSCIGITANVYSETLTVAAVTVPVQVTSYVSPAAAAPDSYSSATTLTETVTSTATQVLTQTEASSYPLVSTTTVTETETRTSLQTETSSTQVVSVVTSTITEVQTQTQTQTETSSTQVVSVVTEYQTSQITSTITEIQAQTQTQTQTQTATETSSTQVVSTVTEYQTQVSTVISTATPSASACPAAAAPLLKNGNFESGILDPWTVSSAIGNPTVSIVTGGVGGNKALDIYTSYFSQYTTSSVVVSQTISCVQGVKYRIDFNYAVVSSYTNGNPWSVVVDGATIVSGAGSAVAWTTSMYSNLVCGASGALLEIRCQSITNRAVHLQVDNVNVTPLNAPN